MQTIPRTPSPRQGWPLPDRRGDDTSTAPLTNFLNGDLPGEAAPLTLQERYERARAVVAASRLDNVISNADLFAAVCRQVKAEAFDHTYSFKRESVTGKIVAVPAWKLTRRWTSASGRANVHRDMVRRMNRLMEVDECSAEQFKLFTVTFRGVAESWQGQGVIRALMEKIRHWAERRGRTITYIWVAEVQRRLAIHYHIVISNCPYIPPKIWRRWAPAPQCKLEVADQLRAARYLAKYLRKSTADHPKSGDLVNLLFSAMRKRHFGSSRLISFREPTETPWIRELEELLDGEAYVASYGIDEGEDLLLIELTDKRRLTLTWTPLLWALTTSPDSG